MEVTILGTASPLATMRTGNAGTGLLVRTDAVALLVDCGPGITNRLQGLGIDIRTIGDVLLTHHHWDHVADLGHFVLGRWEVSQFGAAGGKAFAPPLNFRGPEGTRVLLDRLFGAEGVYAACIATRFAEDIGVPLYGTRGILPPFPPIVGAVNELAPGDVFTLGDLKVTTGLALHCQPYLQSLAYRIDGPGGSLVFSGDTAPAATVTELARGADLLLHDCNVREEVRAGLGRETIHSTATEVGRIAAAADVHHVVAVHHGLAPDDTDGRERLRQRIAGGFGGRVSVARELETYRIAGPGRPHSLLDTLRPGAERITP